MSRKVISRGWKKFTNVSQKTAPKLRWSTFSCFFSV